GASARRALEWIPFVRRRVPREEGVERSLGVRPLDVREVLLAPALALLLERLDERSRPRVVAPDGLRHPEAQSHQPCSVHRSPPTAKSAKLRSAPLRESALRERDGSIRTSRTRGRPSPASRRRCSRSRSAGDSMRAPTAPKSR